MKKKFLPCVFPFLATNTSLTKHLHIKSKNDQDKRKLCKSRHEVNAQNVSEPKCNCCC